MTPALDWVLDTNILIYLLKGDPVLTIYLQGSSPAISFASKIELLSIPTAQPHTESQMTALLSNLWIHPYTSDVESETIRLRRYAKLALADALILATANVLQLPLVTADRDFQRFQTIANIIFYSP